VTEVTKYVKNNTSLMKGNFMTKNRVFLWLLCVTPYAMCMDVETVNKEKLEKMMAKLIIDNQLTKSVHVLQIQNKIKKRNVKNPLLFVPDAEKWSVKFDSNIIKVQYDTWYGFITVGIFCENLLPLVQNNMHQEKLNAVVAPRMVINNISPQNDNQPVKPEYEVTTWSPSMFV
jgi:hypothetical protein